MARAALAGVLGLPAALPVIGSSSPEPPAAPAPRPLRPNVLFVTVDTLRADRVSALGYERNTTPNIDRLLEGGVNFTRARTVEPLTNPALTSMWTSRPAHAHGATRNGLRVRRGLPSLPNVLRDHGYRTAAFVSNWTLRDKLSGLAEHFDVYQEVLTRARWFGFVRSEATARDVNQRFLAWADRHAELEPDRPFLAWVHYVEPHAPYVTQKEFLAVLGKSRPRSLSRSDRYDTEIAFTDAAIGELLAGLRGRLPRRETLVVFVSDHGESLGEHDYWGHGRHLYEPTLRVPMGLYWSGRLPAVTVEAPALNTDLAPTVLGLLDISSPPGFQGYDWTGVLRHGAAPPRSRITRYEAHRGAVISKHRSELARRSGLLEVAVIEGARKEILRVRRGRRLVFDLASDPRELQPVSPRDSAATELLLAWKRAVVKGLTALDDDPPEPLDDESVAALRSLGYVE